MIKLRIKIEILKDEIPRKKFEAIISPIEASRRKMPLFQLFLYYACDGLTKLLGEYFEKTGHENYNGPIVQHEVNIKSETEDDNRKFFFNEPTGN